MKVEMVINEALRMCCQYGAETVWLYGSRAKGTQTERSDIDLAVSGVEKYWELLDAIEDLPTLYSVDLVNLDTCKNELLLEDIREYGQKIYQKV